MNMNTQRSARRMMARVLAAGAAAAVMTLAVPVAASADALAGADLSATRAAQAELTFRCTQVSGDPSSVEGQGCTPNQQGPIESAFIIQTGDGQEQWECQSGLAATPAFVLGRDCEPID